MNTWVQPVIILAYESGPSITMHGLIHDMYSTRQHVAVAVHAYLDIPTRSSIPLHHISCHSFGRLHLHLSMCRSQPRSRTDRQRGIGTPEKTNTPASVMHGGTSFVPQARRSTRMMRRITCSNFVRKLSRRVIVA